MPQTSGILLDVDYSTNEQGESQIELFVRTQNGLEKIQDTSFKPYFFAVCKNGSSTKEKLEKAVFGEEKAKIRHAIPEKKTNAEHVLRLEFKNTQDLMIARQELKQWPELEIREYDIPFAKRYLIDSGLSPLNEIEIGFEEKNGAKILQKIATEKKQEIPELKMAAFDLETYSPDRFSNPEKDPILMISLADGKETIIFSTKPQWKNKKNARIFENETGMLKGFFEEIKKRDLDALITYNGDSFDFPYLRNRAKKLGLKAGMGFEGSEPVFKKKGLDSAAKLKGIQHIDAFQLVQLLARFGTVALVKFDLESVSKALFGKEKNKVTAAQINQIWDSNEGLEELFEYNLEDAECTYKIVEQYWPLLVEFCRLVRFNLFDMCRSSASQAVEALLLIKAHETNTLAPNKPSESAVKQRLMSSYIGGYVKEPIAGLHENIAVLDFRSLHPSIMVAHNVSPDSLKCEHKTCQEGKNVSPDKDWFCEKKGGFLVSIVRELLKHRSELKTAAKKMDKKNSEYTVLFARQWALKILLNSFYGTLGFARFRWYSRESARAITAWSRHYIREVMHEAEQSGFTALYGDSITAERFVTIKNPKGHIELKNIEKFFEENKQFVEKERGKELVRVKGFEALSVNPKTLLPEWKPINFIVRHQNTKQVYRIIQKFGEIRVTEDHSVLVEENNKLKETRPIEMNQKRFFSPSVPESKEIKTIDLLEEFKKYSFYLQYKGRTKTAAVKFDREFVWFGWMNQKEPVKVKRFVKVGTAEFEALCRLLGAYIAEGSSSTFQTSVRSGASICSSNKIWLESLQMDYNQLFKNVQTCIIPSQKLERNLTYYNQGVSKTVQYMDNTHKLQMMNQTTAVFFKVLCGQKSNGKYLPNFIFNVSDSYKKILLEKMLEGDGSHAVNKKLGYSAEYIKNNFSYTTKYLGIISGLNMLLKQLFQNHGLMYRESKECYSIKTCTTFNKRMQTKITEEFYQGFVYDLNVQDNNNFVDACGQVLLHNTDSSFLLIPPNKTQEDVKKFVETINKKLPESMELELESFYKRGIFVTKKGGKESAAKKRYALMDFNNQLKIVGFEYVRRDWSPIAKETQKKVIEAVLKEGKPEKAVEMVKQAIKRLQSGTVPKKELVVLTQIKRPLDKYEATGPHVEAAKKAIKRGKQLEVGSVIGFIITKNGKSISDKAEAEEFVKEGNYDADYYIHHQLIPAVIKILQELGYSEQDLIQGGKQTGLGAFQ